MQPILVTRSIYPDVIRYLREFFEVEVNEGGKYTPSQLKAALSGKSGVLIAAGDRVDAQLIEGLTQLKAVCVTSAGYNNLDLPALTRAGILAANAGGPIDETTADFAWGLLLAASRHLGAAERWLREGSWKGSVGTRFFGTDVYGKSLGILGMGRIGRAIARRGSGFRMIVRYHNRRRLEPAIETSYQAGYVSLEALLRNSDYLVLSLPFTPDNRHLIGARELALMRPTAMLINIARGGLVDEQALYEALRDGRLAGAGLDVFEREPEVYPGLLTLQNVVLTPHIAGATDLAQHFLAREAADNLVAALGEGPMAGHPHSALNPEVLEALKK